VIRIVVGPLAGLAGVFVGAWLSRSWQQSHWERDNRKAEYRELISGLSQSTYSIMDNFNSRVGDVNLTSDKDYLQETDGATSGGYNLISDRLFIAEVMKRENIRDRWLPILQQQSLGIAPTPRVSLICPRSAREMFQQQ
jgi:hypothetical protein